VLLTQAAVPPFYKNGFLVACEETREAVLIDPGDEVGDLLAAVRSAHVNVKAILLTHAHLDHITGVSRAKSELGAPVWLHADDLFLYNAVVEHGLMFGLQVERQPPVDAHYAPGTPFLFGRYQVDVLHTPGHCPGGVCLAIGRVDEPVRELFVGDTLFSGSIGRTDLPGGDHATLISSIRSVLFAFPDDTLVHPGHGPDTTIARERRTNPFLVGSFET
jgi:glyoxylase-like metal-dependent hydrolase (beta-lactamase superfamily II)